MATINHRKVSALVDDPTSDISSGEWNDSLVIRGDGALGDLLVRDPAAPDGWKLTTTIPATSFSSYIAIGTNPAQSGAIRLQNNQGLYSRDVANTADVRVCVLDSGNYVRIGGSGAGAVLLESGTTAVALNNVGALHPFTDNTQQLGTSSFRWKDGYFGTSVSVGTSISIGTNPAQSGGMRLANGDGVYARNPGNTADVRLVYLYTDNTIYCGQGAAGVTMQAPTLISTTLSVGTNVAQSGAIRLQNNIGIYARNAANTADVLLLRLNTADQIEPGGSGGGGTVPTDHISLTDYLAVGTNPAQSGALRLAADGFISWRNGANSADAAYMVLGTDNNLYVNAPFSHVWQVNGTNVAQFGANGMAITASALSIGTNPASMGAIRLGSGTFILWRDAANTMDHVGLFPIANYQLACTGHFVPSNDSQSYLGFISNRWLGGSYAAFISVGANVAQTGGIRLQNSLGVYARNAANTADIALVYMGGDNNVNIGAAGSALLPNSSSAQDIGVSNWRWRDLYLGGTVDAAAYKVGGVTGASKAAGPVSSITVVNGIVTAIS